MRPLFHPTADAITVEGILHALADPVRAQIFAAIVRADGAQTCSNFLEVNGKAVPKSTLSQHFRVLREAGLIRSERQGVELHNTPRSDELQARFGALVCAIVDAHAAQTQRSARRKQRVKAA